MWLFPVFTTKDTTVPGLNHRVSLAPTAVTQSSHSPADLLLLHMTGYNIYAIIGVYNNQDSAALVSAFILLLSYSHKLESAPQILCIFSRLLVRIVRSVLCRCLRSFFPMSLLCIPACAGCFLCCYGSRMPQSNNSVLQSIWGAPFPNSRPKHELNNCDTKQEEEGSALPQRASKSNVVKRSCLPLKIILAARKMSLSPSELLATTSEPKQAYVCSVKTSHVLWEDRHAFAHMNWISAYMYCLPLCFCDVFLLFPAGILLEVQTSQKESKSWSWERREGVKVGHGGPLRGEPRLNKQKWWWQPIISTCLISLVCSGHAV